MPEIDKKASSQLVDLMSDAQPSGSNLLSTHQLTQQHSRSAQDIDLLTGSSTSSQQNQPQPPAVKQDLFSFGDQQQQQQQPSQQQAPKLGANDIMSLYNTAPAQSQYSAYTGAPVSTRILYTVLFVLCACIHIYLNHRYYLCLNVTNFITCFSDFINSQNSN